MARDLDLAAADLDRLELYADLLVKWQRRINLVGGGTVADMWRRHFLDSAQLRPLVPAGALVVDLGSGAGFPGLVLAILHDGPVHLVESDARKCAFLREADRVTGAGAVIHNGRIEALDLPRADVVTARALASLDRLLAHAAPILKPGGFCLFPKGRAVASELTEIGKTWNMTLSRIPSRSDPSGVVLRIEGISRKDV
ncbi:MAG: 16S rRNA (guanine(527)-N(7))-methyltransferase RsmG [Hyphomicrobiales bacterium]|nr:16S rRNA (guanine(527)-N(7))-methyltransferase RsmG [Hyphomicrobiales bacterium]MCP5370469.1 16S rRNA (guanine(527)-N(7))-methyltransferase RsmG [Hyphomicrobiales bacterium]